MKTLAFLATVFLLTATVSAQKFDLTGEWIFDVQTDGGSGQPTLTFKQDGEKLTGKYKGQLGEADITGTVSGKTLKSRSAATRKARPLPSPTTARSKAIPRSRARSIWPGWRPGRSRANA